jgi:hypothetical protein
MARNTTKPQFDKPEFETCDHERVFASPVALAFVRLVVGRRGITDAQARQVYLDYINRTQPGRAPLPAERGCVD